LAGIGVTMAISKDHELHKRRGRRNAAVGLLLGGFVVMVFAITVVKMQNGASMEAFDHSVRPGLTESGQ